MVRDLHSLLLLLLGVLVGLLRLHVHWERRAGNNPAAAAAPVLPALVPAAWSL
jgi:hypothetical protein